MEKPGANVTGDPPATAPTLDRCAPGQRVRVIQTVARREGDWTAPVEGALIEVTQAQTGSWYAHGKNGRLWLWRLMLKKADGEISVLVVDQYTTVELLDDHGNVIGRCAIPPRIAPFSGD